MRLALKLSILLALASATPLLLALTFTLPSSRAALRSQVNDFHVQTARLIAREAEAAVLEKIQALVLWSSALRFFELTSDEQQRALQLVYRQTRDADIVGLFDGEGDAVVPPVYLEDPQALGLAEHEAVTKAGLDLYARSVPLEDALGAGVAVGPVYVLPDAKGVPIPRVVVAVALGKEESERWVLALEISLRSLRQRFTSYGFGKTGSAILVDASRAIIANQDGSRTGEAFTSPEAGASQKLGASATVPLLGWTVHVEQDMEEALAAVQKEAGRASLWVGVGLALALGLGLLALRTVTVPVGKLRSAALRVADGDLKTEVDIRGQDELAMLGSTFNQMTRGLRERERLRQSFGRYVSDEIADRILREQSDLDVKGVLAEVTVLFLDIRGFTSLSERHHPREVIDLINAYFEQAVHVVLERGGVINKFLGDGILAVFGLSGHSDVSAQNAVQAALEISQRVARFNEARRAAGSECVNFGMGINTGPVICGNVGTAERLEYTVIGDAVNVAQRVQSNASDGTVLLSADTRSRLGTRFAVEHFGILQVKGRANPVEVYRVLTAEGVVEPPPPAVAAVRV